MNTNGKKLKQLRELAGFNQSRFAKKINVGQAHLSNVERGARNLSPESLQRAAKVLGVETRKLVK